MTEPKDTTPVAAISREQLIAWLKNTDRRFIVFNAEDLLNSLSYPDGAESLQQIVFAYGNFRRDHKVDTGREMAPVKNPDGTMTEAGVTMSDQLTKDECEEAIQQLIRIRDSL